MYLFFALAVLMGSYPLTSQAIEVKDENSGSPFGVDCSFPIHYRNLRCNNFLPHQQEIYEEFMQGCYDTYGKGPCDDYENDRIRMSLEQPQSMVNFTETGFKKLRAPTELFNILKNHFDTNFENRKVEKWPKGNIYVK